MSSPLKIGMSACFFHADDQRPIFKGKTLLYMEQSMAHYVMSRGAMPVLMPTEAGLQNTAFVNEIDGLLLQGGSDVAPQSYGEEPMRPEWAGDAIRDAYEIDLIKECLNQRKPILGICRGIQIINVALGGTLYQDITEQIPDSLEHRNWDKYDSLQHDIAIKNDTLLQELYQGKTTARINSVHHQSIKDVADELAVEAICAEDGVVEAVRHDGETFVYGVQWHPEFQKESERELLDHQPLMKEFLSACTDNEARQ